MEDSDRVWREKGLREAVLAGDDQAWQFWYGESFDRLDAYVVWRCGGLRELADDMVQDTWLTAVRRMREFNPEVGSFIGWLRGIAAGLLRNRLRQMRRRPAARVLVPDDAVTNSPDGCDSERIALALAALPDHYERLLRAKYLDDEAVSDIARVWNQSQKSIESLLTRAREAFRKAYGTDE